MLDNLFPSADLRGLAARRANSDEYRSVRHVLVGEEVAKGWTPTKRNKITTRLRKSKTHDRLFEDRVWTLMYRMGFSTLSGSGGAYQRLNPSDPKTPDNQIDVVALDQEVAFAIECKSALKPRKFADFSADLAKHTSLREGFTKAIRAQFPVPHKRPAVFAIWTAGIIG